MYSEQLSTPVFVVLGVFGMLTAIVVMCSCLQFVMADTTIPTQLKVGSVEETLNVLDYTAIQIYSNSNCTAKYAYARAAELLEERKLHVSK